MPRIPLTWLAEHVELPADLTAEQLAADLVRVGLEEEAIHPAAVTGPLVVGQVVELTPEPQKNGKTINWCRVDVGPDHNEPGGAPRGIVCGAHNFAVGDRVVVALPGAVLPGPFADRVAQDVRARVRRHDLLGTRARPRATTTPGSSCCPPSGSTRPSAPTRASSSASATRCSRST